MDKEQPQRVTRYKLTVAFEELYTTDPNRLAESANTICELSSAIQHSLAMDTALQDRLAAQDLTLCIMAPARASTRQGPLDTPTMEKVEQVGGTGDVSIRLIETHLKGNRSEYTPKLPLHRQNQLPAIHFDHSRRLPNLDTNRAVSCAAKLFYSKPDRP
jgi:hypothetical protein